MDDIKNMTEEELLQRAKELLIKYKFSYYALYDNRIDLGIEVPKELEAQWRKEYYEEFVETFDWSDKKYIYWIEELLGYCLNNNYFSLLDRFYEEQFLNYSNIHVEKKYRIIGSIRRLSDDIIKMVLDNKKSVLCQTLQQEKYVKKLFDLADEIYNTIDKNKDNLPSDIEKSAFPSKTEEERKEIFINVLEKSISRLRENRKIIGL